VKRLLVSFCLAFIFAQAVFARDAASAQLSTAPTPASFNWSGFYVGAHGGWLWQESKWDDPFPALFFNGPEFRSFNLNHGFIGLQGGWNRQLGNFVAGSEVDFSWSGASGGRTDSVETLLIFLLPTLIATNTSVRTITSRTDWFGTATARVGYTWGRLLAFSRGGVAGGHFNYMVGDTEVLVVPPSGPPLVSPGSTTTSSFAAAGSDTRLGWTVGAGLEWAIWDRVSAKIEYDYLAFPSRSVSLVGAGFAIAPQVAQTIQAVKVGLNWNFGGP
jgi:outer membrane immunogenic protein